MYQQFLPSFFCCLLYFLTVRGPLCKKEKESERLFIIFRKCSIAAVVAKRIEMASGLFRAYFGLVMGSIRTLSELAPGTFWAHSVLDSNRIEMASDCDISGLVQTWCWAGSRLEKQTKFVNKYMCNEVISAILKFLCVTSNSSTDEVVLTMKYI